MSDASTRPIARRLSRAPFDDAALPQSAGGLVAERGAGWNPVVRLFLKGKTRCKKSRKQIKKSIRTW